MTDSYPSLPLRDAVAMQQRATAGDAEARAYFNGLFAKDDECFTCAEPVGSHITIQTIADPRHKGQAILTPICGTCAALPALEFRRRILKMAKAMWPRAGVWQAHNVPRGRRAA
jgi:hypothetical protein